jgi:hypothetical protein
MIFKIIYNKEALGSDCPFFTFKLCGLETVS